MDDEDLVFGWRAAAEVAGLSERYLRDIAEERDLVADHRRDGAVGIPRAVLVELRRELGRDDDDAEADNDRAPASEAVDPTIAVALDPGPAVCRTPAVATSSDASVSAAKGPDQPDGELTARTFEHFSAGLTPVQVVVEMRLTAPVVEALYDKYLALDGRDSTSTGLRSRVDELAAAVETLNLQIKGVPEAARVAGSNTIALAQQCGTHDVQIAQLADRLTILESQDQESPDLGIASARLQVEMACMRQQIAGLMNWVSMASRARR